MGEGDTSMEARLAAITASINRSRVLLASSAERLGVKERRGQVATAGSFITTSSPMSMQDRVREKPDIKPSSPSLISMHRIVAAGALQADAVITPTMPTRYSTVGSAVNIGNNPAVLDCPAPNLTSTGDRALHGAGGTGTNRPAGCSTHFLASPEEGFVDGARATNTDQPRNNFPHFDGSNPHLWRVQCRQYFNRFNISKCLWFIAATMHMEGKANVWYDAYRLRQTVGDWSEFMDNVESHFADADLAASITILGTSCPSVHVHTGGHISPAATTKCTNENPTEVMVMNKDAEPAEPTLPQLTEHLKLQAVVDKLGNATQTTEPISISDEEVLTHVGGFSLFEELEMDSADVVFSDNPLKYVLWGEELVDCVVTHSSLLFPE